MIDYINKAMYIVTGDYTTARTLSICIITIVTLLLFALILHICRVRQKAVFVSIGAILTAFAVSSCFFLAPLHVVRYNGTYSDYEGVTDVADTHFVAKYKGITASVVRDQDYHYVAYVGGTNATVVVIGVPGGVTAYIDSTETLMMTRASSEANNKVMLYRVSASGTIASELTVSESGTRVTTISGTYGVIRTEIPVYDSTLTTILYQGGYEKYYEAD